MSDTFDHEGDAWDSLDNDYRTDGWHHGFGLRYRYARVPQFDRTCAKCGMRGLKWCTNDSGNWQLYENERVEHNRLKAHDCSVASVDDFGVFD